MKKRLSWGRIPSVTQVEFPLAWRSDNLPGHESMLPYGMGRSYGDVCLNDRGTVLTTRALQHFIHFDQARGILRAEAGITLTQIIDFILPHGWFLPVTPGTKYVTLGGAIANDVHGKNHHQAGSFGCHVNALELLRSDGTRIQCSPQENPDWFNASIGGLGLTGLITWAEIRLLPVRGPYIQQHVYRFHNLEGFLNLSQAMGKDWTYTASWVDCVARGKKLGRGLFFAGNHAEITEGNTRAIDHARLHMPLDVPGWVLNHQTIKAFNQSYYHKPRKRVSLVHYDPFFYPLDKITDWNRMYGKRGFYQYQCVLPHAEIETSLGTMLDTISKSGQGSFLSVLKQLGDKDSPGMLSFPRPGYTLALDFANHGDSTLKLLEQLDAITMQYNGAVYPAKDACMSAAAFRQYFPAWQEFQAFIDPHFSSSFWRRVTTKGI